MKKIYYIPFIVVVIATMISCNDESVNMGDVSYYPKFLWCGAKMDTLVKTYDFDFSQDAKDDSICFAEFEFVDNDGKLISQDEMIVYVDGKQTDNNRFRINYDDESKEIGFTFTEQSKEGKHQGYLRLVNHNLDRIDNQLLQPGQSVDVFRWTVHFEHIMNPLAKVLMWVGIIIVIALLFWFIILRPSVYPHFGNMKKTIIVKQNGNVIFQKSIKFTGARKVLLSNIAIKQSIWERIFIGKTITVINPLFANCLRFTPRKKGAIAIGANYTVDPNPIPNKGNPYINIDIM